MANNMNVIKDNNISFNLRTFTFFAGIVFIIIGILGFIPGLTHAPHISDPNLTMNTAYGRLFGLFPVNAIHNLVHIGLGVWALVAARDVLSAKEFCRISAVLYGLLAIIGIIPRLNTMFGLVPLFGHDVWLHIAIAAATGYMGYVWKGVGVPGKSY